MKKLIILFTALFITAASASAQYMRSAGMSLDYGTYAEGFGLGFRYQNELGKHFRAAPNFTYYFNTNNKQGWNLNLDFHYLIELNNERLQVYPILGLDILSIEYKNGDRSGYSKNGYGCNMGGGIQFALAEHFDAFGEMRYALLAKAANQLAISVGVVYKF